MRRAPDRPHRHRRRPRRRPELRRPRADAADRRGQRPRHRTPTPTRRRRQRRAPGAQDRHRRRDRHPLRRRPGPRHRQRRQDHQDRGAAAAGQRPQVGADLELTPSRCCARARWPSRAPTIDAVSGATITSASYEAVAAVGARQARLQGRRRLARQLDDPRGRGAPRRPLRLIVRGRCEHMFAYDERRIALRPPTPGHPGRQPGHHPRHRAPSSARSRCATRSGSCWSSRPRTTSASSARRSAGPGGWRSRRRISNWPSSPAPSSPCTRCPTSTPSARCWRSPNAPAPLRRHGQEREDQEQQPGGRRQDAREKRLRVRPCRRSGSSRRLGCTRDGWRRCRPRHCANSGCGTCSRRPGAASWARPRARRTRA